MKEKFKKFFAIFMAKLFFSVKLSPENLAKLDLKHTIEKTPSTSFCFINYKGHRFVAHYVYEYRRIEATLYFEDKEKITKLLTKRKYNFN